MCLRVNLTNKFFSGLVGRTSRGNFLRKTQNYPYHSYEKFIINLDCRPTVGQELAVCRSTVGCLLVDCWPTVSQQVFWGAIIEFYPFSRQNFPLFLQNDNLSSPSKNSPQFTFIPTNQLINIWYCHLSITIVFITCQERLWNEEQKGKLSSKSTNSLTQSYL